MVKKNIITTKGKYRYIDIALDRELKKEQKYLQKKYKNIPKKHRAKFCTMKEASKSLAKKIRK
jgi:hypothetical protein